MVGLTHRKASSSFPERHCRRVRAALTLTLRDQSQPFFASRSRAGTHCRTRRRREGHETGGRAFGGRQAADRHGVPAIARASAAHPRQLRQPAVRRRALGPRGPEGPLRLRAEDAGARHRSARAARPAGRDGRRSRRTRSFVLDRLITAELGRPAELARSCGPGSTSCDATRLADSSDRRHHHRRPAGRHRQGDDAGGVRRSANSSCRRYRTRCSSATRPAGSTMA